jgi:hypothetical protein
MYIIKQKQQMNRLDMKPSRNKRSQKQEQDEKKKSKLIFWLSGTWTADLHAVLSRAKTLGTFQFLKSLFTASAQVNFGRPLPLLVFSILFRSYHLPKEKLTGNHVRILVQFFLLNFNGELTVLAVCR